MYDSITFLKWLRIRGYTLVASLSEATVVMATTATGDVLLRTLDTVEVKDADHFHVTLTMLTDEMCNESEGPTLEPSQDICVIYSFYMLLTELYVGKGWQTFKRSVKVYFYNLHVHTV